jgi:hypothetical protein
MGRYTICSLGIAAGLQAATGAEAADIAPVVARACFGRAGQDISQARLATSVLSEVGIIDDDLLKDPTILTKGATPGARAILALSLGKIEGAPSKATDAIELLVQALEQALAKTSTQTAKQVGLSIVGPPAGYGWLFDPAHGWSIRCEGKAEQTADVAKSERITQFEAGTKHEIFSLRKTVEELGLTGDEAKKAGAAQLGFKRERTKQDDGSTKTSTTFTIDGTAGLRLTKANAPSPIYAYANYTLSKARKKPAPTLDPGKKQSDDDTDVLELGGAVSGLLVKSGSDFSIVAAAQSGYVIDYVGNSRRLRIRTGITPGLAWSIGDVCDLGGFNQSDVSGLRFRSRCTVEIETEASHVFKAGTTKFHDHGEFFGMGATFGYDLAAPIAKDSAILGSVRYRLLPTIWGKAPNVERLDATIKYRFYTEASLGFDLGLTWGKGTEPKSLKEEDKLELGFGIIF